MNDADRYDALLEAGREPAWPCPVCTGDRDAEPCSEECECIVAQAKRDRDIQGYRFAHRQAVKMALRYRDENRLDGLFGGDRRIRKCLRMAATYRALVNALRAA